MVDWENIINNLSVPAPEVGASPPTIESIKKGVDLETEGEFSKLTIQIWFFVDKETGKTYTTQKHNIIEYGDDIELGDAIAEIKRQQKLTRD